MENWDQEACLRFVWEISQTSIILFEQEHLLLGVAYFIINKISETQKHMNEHRGNLEIKFTKV